MSKMNGTGGQFNTVDGKNICLEVLQLNPRAVAVNISNLNYRDSTKMNIRSITFVALVYLTILISVDRVPLIDFGAICYLLYTIYKTFRLIQSETVIFINEFGLQSTTTYFLGFSTNKFIPRNEIHDVIINEVLCDLRVIYLLAIRTKGNLFNVSSIIPLFNNLKPNVACLEIIYKELKLKVMASA